MFTSQFEIFNRVQDDDTVDGLASVVHFLLQPDIELADVVHGHLERSGPLIQGYHQVGEKAVSGFFFRSRTGDWIY